MSFSYNSHDTYATIPDISSSIFPISVPSSIFRESEAGGYPDCPCSSYYPQKVDVKIPKQFNITDAWNDIGVVVPYSQVLNNNPDADTMGLHCRLLGKGKNTSYEFRMVQTLSNGKLKIWLLPTDMNFMNDRLVFGPVAGLSDLGVLQVWLNEEYTF